MKQLTKEQQELINQINNDEFTEAELEAIILLSRSLISNRWYVRAQKYAPLFFISLAN